MAGERGLLFELIDASRGNILVDLEQLLKTDNRNALLTATEVLCELGPQAEGLKGFVPKLVNENDLEIQYDLIEFAFALGDPKIVALLLTPGFPKEQALNYKWILQIARSTPAFIDTVGALLGTIEAGTSEPSLERAVFLADKIRCQNIETVEPNYPEERVTLDQFKANEKRKKGKR